MIVIKANHDRGVALDGVHGLVPRPVDIDQEATGFETLRTLRIYRFAPPQVITGHAEDDEVYVIVMTGSIRLNVRSKNWSSNAGEFVLSAANSQSRPACAAYLPPHAEYTLTPDCQSDVAYARARPATSRAPAIIEASPCRDADGVRTLLDESAHAERLRIKLQHVDAGPRPAVLTPIGEADPKSEALIHLRTSPAQGVASVSMQAVPGAMVESWDTIALAGGEGLTLNVTAGSSATSLLVAAR